MGTENCGKEPGISWKSSFERSAASNAWITPLPLPSSKDHTIAFVAPLEETMGEDPGETMLMVDAEMGAVERLAFAIENALMVSLAADRYIFPAEYAGEPNNCSTPPGIVCTAPVSKPPL